MSRRRRRRRYIPSPGYVGQVYLRSPDGAEVIQAQVPGQKRSERYLFEDERGRRRRQDKRFRRLLSQGWQVITAEEAAQAGEEQKKKNTSVVIGSTKNGDQSHGGDNASGEVENSPNAAKRGQRKRGCRGGQRKPAERQNTRQARRAARANERVRVRVQKAARGGATGVYSPQPLRVSKEMIESAENSAKLLAKLVGRAGIKMRQGVTVNVEELLVALEIGDNPLPALERPRERPKCRVLVTPDCSGSCQSWSGVGQAWALHLSKNPELEIVYLDNANGDFWSVQEDEEVSKLLSSVDILVYLGDSDGRSLCQSYARQGVTVIALDCFAASVARPRLKAERFGQGRLFWVDRVSNDNPATWTEALRASLTSL